MPRCIFLSLCIFLTAAGITLAVIHESPMLCGCGALPGGERSGPVADSLRRPWRYAVSLRGPVDSIVVCKHLRELYVFRDDTLLKIYRIALGDVPIGHKHFQGDEKTPEGLYRIDGKNPFSSCHKNLGVSYPDAVDLAYAKKRGKPAGGDIKIHGLPNGQGHIGAAHIAHDWTNGCMAVMDEEMDELYQCVSVGTPIFIAP